MPWNDPLDTVVVLPTDVFMPPPLLEAELPKICMPVRNAVPDAYTPPPSLEAVLLSNCVPVRVRDDVLEAYTPPPA